MYKCAMRPHNYEVDYQKLLANRPEEKYSKVRDWFSIVVSERLFYTCNGNSECEVLALEAN